MLLKNKAALSISGGKDNIDLHKDIFLVLYNIIQYDLLANLKGDDREYPGMEGLHQ